MSSFVRSLSATFIGTVAFLGVLFPLIVSAQTPTIPGISGTQGNVTSVAGSNASGVNNSPVQASQALFQYPSGIAFDAAGNMYIADSNQGGSGYVYKEDATTGTISLIAGGGSSPIAPNGGEAVGSWIGGASSVAFDSTGNLYIAAPNDSVIDEIPAGTTKLQVYAGTFMTPGSSGDGESAQNARLNAPLSIAVDSDNNLYIADPNNNSIRMVAAGGTTVSTVVGMAGANCGAESVCGDLGPASNAQLGTPSGVFVDSNKNIFVMDDALQSVRVVYNGGAATACLIALENFVPLSGGATDCSGAVLPTPAAGRVNIGSIYLIGSAGLCENLPCGDGQLAASVAPPGTFYYPSGGLAIDGAGNIFVSDPGDQMVREINAQTGVISTVLGSDMNGYAAGFGGDGGPATSLNALIAGCCLTGPSRNSVEGVAIDSHGNLFFADSGNFNIRAVAGIATIVLKPQIITFTQSLPNVTYGAGPITLEANSDSGLVVTYTVTGPATISGSTLTITGAGSVTVTANQTGNSTYAVATPVSQSFTVSPGTLTLTANDVNAQFGTTPTALSSSLTYSIGGLAGNDSLTGTPAYTITSCSDGSSTYTTTTAVGTTCTISISRGSLAVSPTSSANSYTTPFTYLAGALTVIGGESNVITFPTLSGPFVYGMSPVSLTATSTSGLPVTYTASGSGVVTGSASTGYALTLTGAGTVTVTASQAGNAQFAAATSSSQVLQVARATITVAAMSISVPYGTPIASLHLAASISGLVGVSDTTTGAAALSTTYTNTSAVNTTYPITANQGTLAISPASSASNYTFAFVSGTLSVTEGVNTINFPAIPIGQQTYGSTITLSATASSGLPVTYSVAGNATLSGLKLTITGIGPISITANQAGNSNYPAAAPVMVSFTAAPAVLNVIVGYYTRPQGAINPNFTATLSGFVNGDANTPLVVTGTPIITTLATEASSPGTYAITPALGTLFSQNYTFAFVPGQLVVTQAPNYIITASPNALTIPIGQAAQTVLSVNSSNVYQGSITFSCGQVPIGITCTFSPATVNVIYNPSNPTTSGQTNQSTLTVTTAGPSAQLRAGRTNTVLAGIFLLPGGLAGLLLVFQRKQFVRNGRMRQLLVLIVLLSGVLGMGACGSSNNANLAPMGNTTLLITATGTGTPNTGSQNATNILYLTVNVVPLR